MDSSKAVKDNSLDTISGNIKYVNNPSEEIVRTDLDDRLSVSPHNPHNDYSEAIGSDSDSVGYISMDNASRIIRVEDIPLPSDNRNTKGKNTEVLQCGLLNFCTGSEIPKIDKMDVDGDDKMSDVDEDDKMSDVDEDDKMSDVDEDDKMSNVDEDDKESDVDDHDKKSDVDDHDKKSDVDKDHKKFDVDEDDKKLDVEVDDKKLDVDEDDIKSDVDEDDKKSDVDEDDIKSDVDEDYKKSDVDEDDIRTDVEEDDKKSGVDEDDQQSDEGAVVVSEDSVSSVKEDDSLPVEPYVTNSNLEVPESQSDIINETQESTQSENETMDTDENNLEKPEDAWELRTKEDEKESLSDKTLDTGTEDIATGTDSDESISEMSGTAIETETDNSTKETESTLKEEKQSDTDEEQEEKYDSPSDVPESHEETEASTELLEGKIEEIHRSNDDTESANKIDEIKLQKETLEIQSDEEASETQIETNEQCVTVEETSETESQPNDKAASKLQDEIKESESPIPLKELSPEEVSLDAKETLVDVKPIRSTPEMHSESGEEQTKSDEAQFKLEKSIPEVQGTKSESNELTIKSVDLTDTDSEPEEVQIEEVTASVEQLQFEKEEAQVDEEEITKSNTSQVEEVSIESTSLEELQNMEKPNVDDASKGAAEVMEIDSIDQSEDDVETEINIAVQSESETVCGLKSENVNKPAETENISGGQVQEFSIPEKKIECEDLLEKQPSRNSSSISETQFKVVDMDTTNESQLEATRADDSRKQLDETCADDATKQLDETTADDSKQLDETSADDSTKQLDETTVDDSRKQLDETSADDSTKQLDETIADDSTMQLDDIRADDSTKQLDETSADNFTIQLDETRTEDSTKKLDETSADNFTIQLDETRADDSTNQLDETSADDSTMQLDETSADDSTMQLDETSADDSTMQLDKTRADDSTKQLANDITSSKDANKSPVLESGDISDQNTVNIDETPKEPVVDDANVDWVSNEIERESDPIFVHVDTDPEKATNGKNTESCLQDIQDEDFQESAPQEDPIASDDLPAPMEDDVEDLAIPTDEPLTGEQVDEGQGASEEMCIIPDTERVISQAEKDAAAGMIPLCDPSESEAFSSDPSSDGVSGEVSSDKRKSSNIENYIVSLCTDENVNTCLQCCLPRKSKYSVIHNKSVSYICDDGCLNNFKRRYGNKVVMSSEGDLRVKKLASGINNDNMVAKVKFRRKCAECLKKLTTNGMYLSWETMEYCNELCLCMNLSLSEICVKINHILAKYQKRVASNCSNCQVLVRNNCFGKYCVRFGYDIRQFCSGVCLEEYKKGLKVCSYCQKDMSSEGGDGFLAPVGDKGQFKDFCTQHCMEKYDVMSNNRRQIRKSVTKCSVCLNEKPITIEFEHNNKANLFCGEPCFVAFKFVNNITPAKCNMCKNYFDNKILEQNSMFYDNAIHSFCSKSCQNIYIIGHRKIVPCSWCKVKKYNFDMIKRSSTTGSTLLMCSLNCLSLYQISINAVQSKKTKCDHCQKILQPLYHLTMSDATMRNFCSYPCVMAFQNQFPKTPITLNEPDELSTPVPTGGPKKSKRVMVAKQPETAPAEVPTIPVISSVQSLATTNGPTTGSARTISNTSSASSVSTSPPTVKTHVKQQFIFKPVPIPPQRNIGTLCKVNMQTKAVHCKPTICNKEVQTDEVKDKTAIVPIPVPIYVPCPMWMYSMPFPIPFPFPLPVPVPIFIPTTRNSANGIMKEIKKIQVKIPTDPFEAELLMMAEMVAGDKKDDHTDSESEEEDTAPPPEEATFSPEPVDASNAFGDDMLQMALKMATELDEPAVDLEGALTANTITASQGSEPAGGAVEEPPEQAQPIHHIMERPSVRGRKRPGRPPKSGGAVSKRGRRSSIQIDIPIMAPPQPPPPPSEPVEKPDANMCLKYTFGVNAWKQWVTTKNLELEKTSRRVKLFKPEILQLTADELNYSLCLFVKEVRKPNGQEYAPDTIYYLCLGIQQYLFENSRIDNIFCDSYYEKFTDCLDEIAKKFSVLYNDSHYIVTRVEEEHLWESKQLGAHSPHVLLSTLMFFNTKHFNLTTVDEHMQLSFSHIMKHWKRHSHNQPGTTKMAGSRNVLLRFYPPQTTNTDTSQRKKKVYEQQENEENPLRCPVKLYEFYLSKCPESVKTRNDVFYLLPERSCVPDSPVWYSTMPLPKAALEKMLHRVKMVKEINVALLTS
ncbi:hypothetical protein FQR65_LT11900 [Abscondita terminalis]|nr:hypothetical protein FQR65_LT11900 [Abscondita terminalis]